MLPVTVASYCIHRCSPFIACKLKKVKIISTLKMSLTSQMYSRTDLEIQLQIDAPTANKSPPLERDPLERRLGKSLHAGLYPMAAAKFLSELFFRLGTRA